MKNIMIRTCSRSIYSPILKLFLFILFFQYTLLGVPSVFAETGANLARLTVEEIAWIQAHPTIRLAPDPNFQPIEFFDKKGNYLGIGADYMRLITEKLGIKFEVVNCNNWDDVITRMERREVDVLNAVVKTPQREKYLLFPSPYLTIPSVIVVRKTVTKELSLDMLEGMNIVMVSGYGYVDLIRNNHPGIEIELASDLRTALRKVSFGMVDAFVGDLATASFYMESEGITNLKLAGETEPPNISGFAVRSDWPELSSILEKGISLLTEEERRTIHNKWIRLGTAPGLSKQEVKKLALLTVTIIVLIVGAFLSWNRTLNRQVKQRTESLRKEIEERKQAQQAQKESEERFRVLAETSPLAIYMSEGIEQKAVYINPTFIRLFGYTPEEVPSAEHWWPLAYPDAVYRKQVSMDWQKRVEHAIETNSAIEPMEVVVTCKDGSKKNILWDFITTGKQNWACGLDLTKRKQAEEALHENQIIFQSFLENSPVYIFFKDHEIRPLMLSRNYELLLGMPLEDILGKTMDDLFPSDLAKSMIKDDKRILREGKSTTVIEKFAGRIYETTKFPIFVNNKANMLAGFTIDITDRRKAEEEKSNLESQLQQAQKMEAIGTLAGGIAHDFNNILSVILGYAELAQVNSPVGSEMKEDLEQVVEASHRAKDLVKQILAFSRQAETEKKLIQPAIVLTEATKLIRSSLPTTIDIQQNIDKEVGPIYIDPTYLHQILTNLSTNALHAMEETGGTLSFSLKNKEITTTDLIGQPNVQPGTFMQLSVSDTGPGIAPEILEKIFDPYFTTKEVGKGSGMGLAIIHGIIKKSGGFLTCQNSADNGARFDVYLPIQSDSSLLATDTIYREDIRHGTERILLIDDEERLLEMSKTMLEGLGYDVTTKTSSVEAMEFFKIQPDFFDLVITDQTMPGMTGVDLARRLLQIRPRLPIILTTGFSNMISEEKAKLYGIKGFAMKPIARKDMANLIKLVLEDEN